MQSIVKLNLRKVILSKPQTIKIIFQTNYKRINFRKYPTKNRNTFFSKGFAFAGFRFIETHQVVETKKLGIFDLQPGFMFYHDATVCG